MLSCEDAGKSIDPDADMASAAMQSADIHSIYTHQFSSPLGEMVVGSTEEGVCLLEFIDGRRVAGEFDDLCRLLNARTVARESALTRQVEIEMGEYFAGKRTQFDVAIHMPGTPFQQTVWRALLDIPYGETVSYQAQAIRVGNLKAIRAVALANGANRISVIVPCHRVIGKDGSATGYGGGIERKRWLIAHEQSVAGFRLS